MSRPVEAAEPVDREAVARMRFARAEDELRDRARNLHNRPADRQKAEYVDIVHALCLACPDYSLTAAEAQVTDWSGNGSGPATATSHVAFIDWPAFWTRDDHAAEWVYPDVLARARGHAFYAKQKSKKSLLMLWLAAQLSTGTEPIVVVYLDYEMTEADIRDRLEDMGYGPASDLSRLRYALLPTLPPLDTPNGGDALMVLLDAVQAEHPEHHLVVVIDTIGRAVAGDEDPADTWRAFYRHTGIELKRRGITWARLDHGGKDLGRGQRGSSAKGDDVDVVWKLTPTQDGIRLDCDAARMGWVPQKVSFRLSDEPLVFKRQAGDWPVGTAATADLLSQLRVPLEATTKQAQAALREADLGRRREIVAAALRWRRENTPIEAA